MSPRTDGRVVLLTGGNEGIGHGMATTLLEDGYRVAVFDIDDANLDGFRETYPDRFRFVECDISVDEDVETGVASVLEAWEAIDILVNNVAVFDFSLVSDRSIADTRRVFEVNFFGMLRLVHAVLPQMRERGSGLIHNVSSGASVGGHVGMSGYAATKGAIESFTRSLRLELQREDVTATVMYPNLSRTRHAKGLYPDWQLDDPMAVGRRLAKQIETRKRVIYSDWRTRLGVFLAGRFPWLVERGTDRFLDLDP